MTDIALLWDDSFGNADLGVSGNDLVADDGLETSVFLSLFTDRRADTLPAGQTDRRGWWADAHPVVANDKWGSRLWLLSREKDLARVPALAEEYAREALAWMLDDRLTDQIQITAERLPLTSGKTALMLTITIYRPAQNPATFRYNYNWAAQVARRAA